MESGKEVGGLISPANVGCEDGWSERHKRLDSKPVQMLLAVERKKARMTAKQKVKGFGGKKLTVKRPAKKSPQAKGTRKR